MPPSRQVYLRRRALVTALAIVVLGILFYLPLTLLAPVPATKAVKVGYTAPVTPTQTLSLPTYGDSAIAAVVAPQAPGKPMIVVTPQGRATIVGRSWPAPT